MVRILIRYEINAKTQLKDDIEWLNFSPALPPVTPDAVALQASPEIRTVNVSMPLLVNYNILLHVYLIY